jgi:hypothetical protein
VIDYLKDNQLTPIPICPEQLGGYQHLGRNAGFHKAMEETFLMRMDV